jgi:hypothetical protein
MNYTKAGETLYDWVLWRGKPISVPTKLFLTCLSKAILQVDASRGHCLSTSLPVPISNEFVFLHYSSWLQRGYKYQRRVRRSQLWVHLQLSTSVASIFHSTIFEKTSHLPCRKGPLSLRCTVTSATKMATLLKNARKFSSGHFGKIRYATFAKRSMTLSSVSKVLGSLYYALNVDTQAT